MKTDQLISMLASGTEAIEPNALSRRYATALGWGAFGSTLLMAVMFGVRTDLAEAAHLPMFWAKLAFPAGVLAGALPAVIRLSRPGMRLGHVPAVIAASVLATWVLATFVLLGAAPGEREKLIFGDTWAFCLFNIPILSMPILAALLWAMKGLAPTQLALSGSAAGLLSGAGGALLYALYCTEMAAPFLGTWYLLGMLIPTAFGAALGPHLLRW